MDWYNVAYWSNNPGAFDIWGSIYPPLSFVFIRLLSIKSCYDVDSFIGRDCDWIGRAALITFFVVNAVVVFRCYRFNDRRTALVRTTAVTLGLPMLFAMDRGNLIVPCFTCFALGHGRVLRSARQRWLAVALSINFKPYLVAAIAPYLLRRRWRWLEGCAVATILVYVATYAVWGSGSPGQILANEAAYALGQDRGYFEGLYYPTSYVSVTNYFEFGVAIMRFVGSRPIEWLTTGLPLSILIGEIGVLVAFGVVAIGRSVVPVHRLAAMGVAAALSTTEVGGYAEVFLLFLVFLEPWRGPARIVALVSAYLLCIPTEFPLVPLAHKVQDSYLTQRTVGYDLSVNLGSLVRPGLLLIIQYALTVATLADVLKGFGQKIRRPVGPDLGASAAVT